MGDYVILARRHDTTWFLSCITDWDSREFSVPLDFLSEGVYTLDLISDGVNAHQRAIDHIHETSNVQRDQTVRIDLAPGGGWIGRFSVFEQ